MIVSFSLVSFGTLWYVNDQLIVFTNSELILIGLIAVLIFGIFNFRKKAICFAGDVGSISIAFILGYLMIRLVLISGDWTYLLLFLVYGLDAGLTIIERILKGENILKPHRSHLYQLFANQLQIKHLTISSVYAGIQLQINFLFLAFFSNSPYHTRVYFFLVIFSLSMIGYIALKRRVYRSIQQEAA